MARKIVFRQSRVKTSVQLIPVTSAFHKPRELWLDMNSSYFPMSVRKHIWSEFYSEGFLP